MRKTLLAAAAFGLLAASPVIASAADVSTSPTVVAANAAAPAPNAFHRWVARQQNAASATQYGDPYDPGHVKANQVIIAPVGG